jgi:hypothetical protein
LSIGGNAGTVTNGVYTTDTGTVTNTMLAGSIANAKLTNSSITFGSTAQALGSTVSGLSGVTIDNGAVGGTTPAAVTATTLIGGGGSANYGQLTGGATTKAVEFQTLGSDSNIALVLDTKGTGAIDLAAGSSGVNISNGGTVTAITRTAAGSAYTSPPSVSISAPTTAGGVQATATTLVQNNVVTPTITSGGTGYTAGDTLTLVGGTGTASTLTVSTVSSGVITAISTATQGAYSVVPTNPISVTGGTGSGATFTINSYGIYSIFTITNAGSGYVEQPTVTFSGGGGSGAAAYATVGSVPKITSIGGDLSFFTPGGEGFRVSDNSASTVNYISARGDTSTGNTPTLAAAGTSGTLNLRFTTKSSGSLLFYTNSSTNQQFSITHTASAVNYVQVTGAATNNNPEISAQGSDASINISYNAKNAGNHLFRQAGGANFRVAYSVTTAVNNLAVTGSLAGSSPSLFSQGTDTDIDLTLTPKGAGAVRFGTHTGTILTPTGYITIKDSGGTTRRLLVG